MVAKLAADPDNRRIGRRRYTRQRRCLANHPTSLRHRSRVARIAKTLQWGEEPAWAASALQHDGVCTPRGGLCDHRVSIETKCVDRAMHRASAIPESGQRLGEAAAHTGTIRPRGVDADEIELELF